MPGFLKKKNNARSFLAQTFNSGDSSMVISDVSKFPSSPEFVVTIWDKDAHPDPSDDPNTEIVKVTNIVGSIFEVERGQEGTSTSTHSPGHAVELLITAGQITEITDLISSLKKIEEPSGTIDGSNRTFTTSQAYVAGSLEVIFNGQHILPGASRDYVEIDETTFQFNLDSYVPKIGNKLLVIYNKKI